MHNQPLSRAEIVNGTGFPANQRFLMIAEPEYRVRVIYDPDYVPEGCNGGPLPEPQAVYEANPITVSGLAGRTRNATYKEYCQYYGNPERHVGLAVLVYRKCTCCEHWEKGVQSLWGIDCMDDNLEVTQTLIGKAYTETDARALPGYLGQIVGELLEEEKGK